MANEVQWVDCGPGCPHPDCLARQEQREEERPEERTAASAVRSRPTKRLA